MAPLLSFLLLLLLLLLLHFSSSRAGPISEEFLYPDSNFTTFHFVDTAGVFLHSRNSTFSAALYDPDRKSVRFYLALLHPLSGTVVWTANPDSPVPFSSTLSLSSTSLSLLYPNGSVAWSTPKLDILALQLLDSGNLVLLGANNSTLWQSFDHPTDTLLPGQRLPVGSSLSSPKSDSDLSDGGHRLIIDPDDASLTWKGSQQYWRLSKDPKSVKDYSADVAYMALNATGLLLLDASDRPVFRVALPPATGFRTGRLEHDGRFTVGGNDFVAPPGVCGLPLNCGSLGLCTSGSNRSCSCPPSFAAAENMGCSPADGSVLGSPSSCGGASSYLSLGNGVEYFANDYLSATASGGDLSSCQSLCSANCSCLGFFYRNSSQSCYLLKDQLGSLVRTSQPSSTGVGYMKTLKSHSPPAAAAAAGRGSSNLLPILLPSIAAILLVLTLSFVGLKWWRRRRTNNKNDHASKLPVKETKLRRLWHHRQAEDDDEFSDGDEISIPGLPTRFTYTELALATNNFGTLIGTGGFGSVYKGELPDGALVAVKRITNMGIQGKREFCTEIAVIGKIHHVNLVRLRGYCVQGTDRMLVYDYMNRSSLDRSLFGQGQCPVLEWQERLEIAVGAARGLAYLHSGCDRKIIHCDIKPENILLADGGQVKIADFGMAKLISPDQSGLFTTMRGTRGYLAPEWLTNSAITDKTDVYSYGMVLLEMVRGRKNSFGGSGSAGSSGSTSFGSGEEYFPMVAVEKHVEGRWVELADPRMEGRVAAEEVERVVKVALCCLHEEPATRPSMAAVAGMLEGTAAVREPVVAGLRFLRMYRRREGGVTIGYVASESGGTTATASPLTTFVSSQEVSGPR